MSSIHEAAFGGDVELVASLLRAGTGPNEASPNNDGRWASAERHPTPLHCALISHALSERHVQIVELLLATGAVVTRSHIQDFMIETAWCEASKTLWHLLSRHAPELLSGPPPWETFELLLASGGLKTRPLRAT